MRWMLRPILLPLFRRDEGEVDAQARKFSVASPEGRELVSGVGRAFLGGYNATLAARAMGEVHAAGLAVASHYRPFFFEGAAMGYLPRSLFTDSHGKARVEAELLEMDSRFRYLYNVGLGFWYGFRHPSRPAALEALAPHLDPFYFPLCYDGFGFKVGFFDVPGRPDARKVLDRAPAERRAEIYQGFGRSLFFVCMEDEARFQKAKGQAPPEYRDDVESGRSLAVAFTGIRRPAGILRHLASSRDAGELSLRLLGVTWALAAREMNDPDYFDACLSNLAREQQALLRRLPQLCREALGTSSSYAMWRTKTRASVTAAYAASMEVLPR